jgi:hypothetical protein
MAPEGLATASRPADPEAEPSRLKVAFVGQSVYFRQCSLTSAAGGLEPTFFDYRATAPHGPLLGELKTLDPDVVVVFRPEVIPHGLFDALRAVTIGYLTEPLPRRKFLHHTDLRARMWWLRQVDPGNFDRIVSFDPLIEQTAGSVISVWRSLPIPVDDSLFADVHERGRPPRLLFLGRPTEHREKILAPIRRSHSIVHIGHGLGGLALEHALQRADVQLNLHNNPYPTFENRVCIALAAGHLVISEPLSPRHGLNPGDDHLEADGAAEIKALVDELARDPGAYLDVQRAGREQAERFRASVVYPQLIREALSDVGEHGSGRRRAA